MRRDLFVIKRSLHATVQKTVGPNHFIINSFATWRTGSLQQKPRFFATARTTIRLPQIFPPLRRKLEDHRLAREDVVSE